MIAAQGKICSGSCSRNKSSLFQLSARVLRRGSGVVRGCGWVRGGCGVGEGTVGEGCSAQARVCQQTLRRLMKSFCRERDCGGEGNGDRCR